MENPKAILDQLGHHRVDSLEPDSKCIGIFCRADRRPRRGRSNVAAGKRCYGVFSDLRRVYRERLESLASEMSVMVKSRQAVPSPRSFVVRFGLKADKLFRRSDCPLYAINRDNLHCRAQGTCV